MVSIEGGCNLNHHITELEDYMRKAIRTLSTFLLAVGLGTYGSVAHAQDVPSDYQQVLKLVGRSGDYKANVLKVNIPRNDLHMTIADYPVPTPFGFGGWFALTKGDGGDDVMMGDLVLLQEEVKIERHDIGGEALMEVIPIGLCERSGCGRFFLIERAGRGRFCSDKCRAGAYQDKLTKEQRAARMRKYRATLKEQERGWIRKKKSRK